MKLDIMQVRRLCKSGAFKVLVRDGALYMKDTDTGEIIMLHTDISKLMQE